MEFDLFREEEEEERAKAPREASREDMEELKKQLSFQHIHRGGLNEEEREELEHITEVLRRQDEEFEDDESSEIGGLELENIMGGYEESHDTQSSVFKDFDQPDDDDIRAETDRKERLRKEHIRQRGRVQPEFVPIVEDDKKEKEVALAELRNHPSYKKNFDQHFEYDLQSKRFKERRKRLASFRPYLNPQAGGYYEIAPFNQIEMVHEYAPHRNIEPYVRTDTQDIVDRHKRSFYNGIDGRAHDYLQIGPWIRLRLLKSTIHIVVKGKPPIRAYEILAKHMIKQLKTAQKPRIIMPNRMKNAKKHMLTVATPERLKRITQFELVPLLRRALNKRLHHIIYRQRNIGGILFDLARQQDTLY
jgi:hypothetical protein